MSVVAKILIGVVVGFWLILVAMVLEDPLGMVGLILLSAATVVLVALIVIVDAAVRSARQLR